MSQQNETPFLTFAASGAIKQFQRVVIGAGRTVSVAGLTEVGDGVATRDAADGELVTIRHFSAGGSFQFIASEAFDGGSILYTESDGEVQDTAQATSLPFAKAVDAATADGDIVECVLLAYRGAAAGGGG